MSNAYTIYNKELAPVEMLSEHPYAPTYKDDNLPNSIEIVLFIESFEDVTGTPAGNIIVIDQSEEELSNEDLDAMVDAYLTGEQLGSELQLIKPRGLYLYETRFKTEEL